MFELRPTSSSLLIATRNHGKIAEWRRLLGGLPYNLRTLHEFPQCPEAHETGDTFAANARLKARFYADHTRLTALADDSGLEVASLDGAPGVFSARYGEPHFTDLERTRYLLDQMENASLSPRAARFVCVIAIADSSVEHVQTFSGTCEGSIALTPRGTKGFGYDPVLIPAGFDRTFAELDLEIKNRISHRARAARLALSYLATNKLTA